MTKQKVEKEPKEQEMKVRGDYFDALAEVKKMIQEGKHPETIIKFIDSVLD